MGWNSVRGRLTLWNMLILALVLGGFGTALCYSVQARQSAAIDRDLADRAHVWLAGPGRKGRGPGPGRGRGQGGERGGGFRPRGPDGLREGRPFRRGGPTLGDPLSASVDGQEPRRPDFWKPLMFDPEGRGDPFHPEEKPWDPAGVAAAARGERKYSTVVVDGERIRVFSAPRRRDGVVDGVVQIAQPLRELGRLVESQIATLLILIPLALLVAGLGGLFLTDRALRPVGEMTQAAAQIGVEDLSRRLIVKGKDELAHLALTFNGMVARLEGAFRGQAEAYRKLETAYEEQRRFTGDASHELRTPLTRIKGSTSLALSGPECLESYREALETADQAADVMTRIVQDLLLLARSDAGELRLRLASVPAETVLRSALSRLEGQACPTLRVALPPEPLEVRADADHLARVFVNLLENACRHTPAAGEITVSARREGSGVVFGVADTGEGIPPEHLPHVCERFYRVDAARARGSGGTGLGLAICRSIVEAHGGAVRIESEIGKGTTVWVSVPAASLTGLSDPTALPAIHS